MIRRGLTPPIPHPCSSPSRRRVWGLFTIEGVASGSASLTEFEELADFAERGELHPIPGTTVRGEAARQEARELMMSATGAETPEEAARLALGRPRAGEPTRGPSRQWRVRAADELHERAEALAAREGVSVSEIVRRAMIDYLPRVGA